MHNVKILLLYIIFFTIIIGIKGIISLLLRLIQKKIQYNISLKYYRQLYSDVSKCNYLNFNDAYFNTKIEQAKLAIEGKISETIFRISDILGAIVSLCGIGILISRVHIIYLLIMIFMTAIQNIFIWINTVQSVELLRTQNIIKRKYDYFVDLLQERTCAKEIRSYKLYAWMEEKRKTIYNKLVENDCNFNKRWMNINFVWGCVMFSLEGGIYCCLIYQFIHGIIQIENIVVIIESITVFISSIVALLELLTSFPKNNVFISSLFDIKREADKEEKKVISSCIGMFDDVVLSMKNVSFSYGEKIVLSNLNLKVKKGEILGIIGENGCGKSTIINLLIGLYTPKKGCIYKSSKEIQTVVFQDFSRFLFTLKENIGFGQLEYINDTQLIWNTIENVGLYGKVKGFRDEINTKMGKELYENGRELSGGEWQKLATGRAEFRNADIFIFDEPTSFLDPIEEKRLVNMLNVNFLDN